ncbi:hypothetical protein BaRGS_00030205, partial [Batillaria attramentaria]
YDLTATVIGDSACATVRVFILSLTDTCTRLVADDVGLVTVGTIDRKTPFAHAKFVHPSWHQHGAPQRVRAAREFCVVDFSPHFRPTFERTGRILIPNLRPVHVSVIPFHCGAKQNKKDLIIRVDDFKDFKKLLRTRTNLLVIFSQSEKAASKSMTVFEDVAEEMKGKATLAFVNCGDDKKFCKKLKVSPVTFELKHYKDGDFNKDYDRKLTVKSMVNFLMDPTGDIPWDEDPTAVDVVHIDTEDGLSKLLKKDKSATLVMFYAPWCGYCKRLKPEFAAAATQTKGRAQLVGIDVDKPHMMGLRASYNITGFPTLYYFEKGKMKYRYGGENTKDGILSWLD